MKIIIKVKYNVKVFKSQMIFNYFRILFGKKDPALQVVPDNIQLKVKKIVNQSLENGENFICQL